ncbi:MULTISPECIES: ATP-binding cassette domain-containing protein [Bacillaceae]|uniref:ABC transporter ATP-binding protein n=1 Tax=Evansella alkalicola TaxID=745819 RepID=A0ABS6JP18_9BACI|nr:MULTISPECIES: ABC transporter ATP-binding protein [Bacillaceae]MBU9720007.1 ABC transporter ATP-binding protein [Bacillus alkalicola]
MIQLSFVTKLYNSNNFGLVIEELEIPTGEIVGVLGANGSGKTTFLKSVMGLGELKRGEVLIAGKPVMEQYHNIAFITEEGSYLSHLTPLMYGEFLSVFFPKFNMEKYIKLLKYFDINTKNKIRTFSKGQKSKVEICAGFSKGAKYILLDEPFLGKDMFTRQDFLKMMISILRTDETILISSHFVNEIENIIDRALIFERGRIQGDYYIDDLREEGKELSEVMKTISGYQENKYQNAMKLI